MNPNDHMTESKISNNYHHKETDKDKEHRGGENKFSLDESLVPNDTTNNLPDEDEIQKEAESANNFLTRLFPVAKAEYLYLGVSCAIFFCLVLVFSLMKITKNAIIADKLDSSSIPYIKFLVVLPANILVVAFTQGLVGKYTVSRAFDVIVLAFSFIFLIYGLTYLKLESFFNMIINKYYTRDRFSDNKMVYAGLEWSYALFSMINFPYVIIYYLVAELHGSIIIQYLLWAVCNQFFTRRQSLRLSPVLIIVANVALFLTNFIADFLVRNVKEAKTYNKARIWNLMGLFLCCMFNTAGWYIKFIGERKVFSKPIFRKTAGERSAPRKVKLGLSKAIEMIWKVRFVLLLSVSVLGYSVISNFVETFANRTAQTYGESKGDVKDTMQGLEGMSAMATAGVTIFLCLIPSHALIKNGYFSIYAYTSCILTLFSVVCFLGLVTFHRFLLYKFNDMTKYNPFFSDKAKIEKVEAYLGCIFRTVQKVLKYAAFDIFKEALSMRIDSTYRAIFKGVYDGQINKLGKAIGALLTIIMNVFYKSKDITESSTLIFLGALTFALFWFVPTYILVKKFNKSNVSNTNIEPGWKGGKPLF